MPLPPPPELIEEIPDNVPAFTFFSVAPAILNVEEIQELMIQEWPPLLRQAGIGGTVWVWAYIDDRGVVEDVRVAAGSGHESLDMAALSVAGRIRCSPALNYDVAIPVWIRMPLEFSAR